MRAVRAATAAMAAAMLVALAGCSGSGDDDPEEGELPDPATLLTAAADEMAQVQTVAIQLTADTDIGDLPVRSVDGVVTADGDAEGTAELEQFGGVIEAQFVMVEGTFYYQLLGEWQQEPAAEAGLYDPSTILDPDQGVAGLLRGATDPEMIGRDGDTYQVDATFPAGGLGGLLPGGPEGVPGTVWIGVDRPLLHRGEFELPGGAMTTTLADFDAPVSISAPV